MYPKLGITGTMDKPVRNLEACLSSLNEAYEAIKDMDLPGLKKQINASIEAVASQIVSFEDDYNDKD
jgi:hypothetical protein